jgi:hypothetical protein
MNVRCKTLKQSAQDSRSFEEVAKPQNRDQGLVIPGRFPVQLAMFDQLDLVRRGLSVFEIPASFHSSPDVALSDCIV